MLNLQAQLEQQSSVLASPAHGCNSPADACGSNTSGRSGRATPHKCMAAVGDNEQHGDDWGIDTSSSEEASARSRVSALPTWMHPYDLSGPLPPYFPVMPAIMTPYFNTSMQGATTSGHPFCQPFFMAAEQHRWSSECGLDARVLPTPDRTAPADTTAIADTTEDDAANLKTGEMALSAPGGICRSLTGVSTKKTVSIDVEDDPTEDNTARLKNVTMAFSAPGGMHSSSTQSSTPKTLGIDMEDEPRKWDGALSLPISLQAGLRLSQPVRRKSKESTRLSRLVGLRNETGLGNAVRIPTTNSSVSQQRGGSNGFSMTWSERVFASIHSERKKKGRMQNMVDQLLYPREIDRDLLFKAARSAALYGSEGIFFGHLKMCEDGGFSKENIPVLFYNQARALQVMLYLSLVPFNFFAVLFTLYNVWQRANDDGRMVLLLNSYAPNAGYHFWSLLIAVCIFECLSMVAMLTFSATVILRFALTQDKDKVARYRTWRRLYMVCCEVIPSMTNFSSLKALEAVHPQVMLSKFYLYLTKAEQGHSIASLVLKFSVKRLLYGTVGILSFTVKFAELATRLQDRLEEPYSERIVVEQLVLLIAFLNQALGIVQIWQVENDRVFLLIFGGEDSALQTGEIDRQEAFLAYMVYTVCTNLFESDPPLRRTFKRAVALLGFSHFDVQSLVLAEDANKEIDADVIRDKRASQTKSMAGQSDATGRTHMSSPRTHMSNVRISEDSPARHDDRV
eukprot:gnl/MRDRNA2_/MRDRNA2_67324_c0_seq1.p1 gnl/MRDRNA2_/MRDRNA2_67324_c0~~gnl/MRDRNA2_/MRDRNA2_67324_c0_seq1.p1  ORF type:complete len:737 (+),score=105.25 gnl/MRDRNA2_/MRDRNA2_67324_c0_seq1:3-2213(+)